MKYYKYKIENLVRVNKIVTVHYFEFDKNFTSETEKHDFWEIVFAEKGNIICSRNGEKTLLKEGQILFHKPYELHSLSADGNDAPTVIIISFDCKSEALHFFEDKVLKCNQECLKIFYKIIKETKKTFNIPYSDPNLKKMPILNKPTLGGLQLIKNYLEILLINLLRKETEIDGENNSFFNNPSGDKVCENIIKILKESVYDKIRIDDLVAKLNYSKSYLFRTFKDEMGCSIISYYNNIKMEKAKKLLTQTDLTVTEISYRLGFDSQSYFTKSFKNLTNYSPLVYRKIFKSK